MNLFILSQDPKECAAMMMDVHIVKIILEAVQMLSTAKRLLDAFGSDYDTTVNKNELGMPSKMLQQYKRDCRKVANDLALPVYKAAHIAHPVCIWVRHSFENYVWTLDLVDAMHDEWRYRYDHGTNVVHKSYVVAQYLRKNPPAFTTNHRVTVEEGSHDLLHNSVNQIMTQIELQEFPKWFALAMPDEYKVGKDKKRTVEEAVESYRNYYRSDMKRKLATWRKRDAPLWWNV
jgi:hypothetical protein